MKKIIFMLIISLISFGTMSAPNLSEYDKEQKELNKSDIQELEYLMTAEFSEYNLTRLLQLLKVDHYQEIVKQAKLETGWFKSKLFIYHNNCFGMHYPYIRDTYSDRHVVADNGAKVASYASWQSSVLDLLLYFEYYKDLGYDLNNYYEFLVDAGYCEKGKGYVKILKSMS
jgi:hypothetical protein